MSKIVSFGSSGPSRDREFGLQDLIHDDVIDTRPGGAAPVHTIWREDWTNQELASIHKAIRLLQGTGIAVETDRGMSDDGSPWYVFCGPQGDVLVHIARIDREYILDGVGLDAPLSGKTFDALIDRFVGGTTERLNPDRQDGLSNILNLTRRKDTTVFIHPAAQLAALIWAAMIVKDAANAQTDMANDIWLQDGPGSAGAESGSQGQGLPASGTLKKPSWVSDLQTSDLFNKPREASHTTLITSAGMSYLAYFLMGGDHMSPEAVFLRLSLDSGNETLLGSSEGHLTFERSTSDLFFDALDLLAAQMTEPVMALQGARDDTTAVVEAKSVAGFDLSAAMAAFTADSASKLPGAGSGFDEWDQAKTILIHSAAVLDGPASAMQRMTGESATDRAQEATTFESLMTYLESLEDEVLQDDLLGMFSVLDEQLPTQQGPAGSGGRQIEDQDVIAGLLAFLKTTGEGISYYRNDKLHVIEHGEALSEEAVDHTTLFWTFEDGSQIMIVGAAQELGALDFLL
jgi:hypothetical protein